MSDLDLSSPFDPDQYRSAPRDPALAPLRLVRGADEIAASATPPTPGPDAADPATAQPTTPPKAPAAEPRAVPWKAAASSVPKLRQQPASLPEPPTADGGFRGFAQDGIPPRSPSAIGEALEVAGSGVASDSDLHSPPRAAGGPPWEAWLARARAIPTPVALGVVGALLLAVAAFWFLLPRGEASIPLARIRQHPEAFDGRFVKVQGRAGETFTVGGSYVFGLRQGRDTIVVYSRTRRPSLHERVQATGTVSIGYLDGAPRVALFESPQTQ